MDKKDNIVLSRVRKESEQIFSRAGKWNDSQILWGKITNNPENNYV